MVVRSSFFNSVGGDRIYDASNFASYFASFIGNGVFPNPSTNLQVLQSSNLTIRVAPGKGFINGYYVENTADLSLQIGIASGVSARIDRIVMGLNLSNRQVTIYVKAGTAASSPVAPALVRNGTIHELALADVNVTRGATSITQANIVDQRMNASLCGIVSGVVNQVDTTTLYNQYQAAFNQFSTQQQQDFQTFLDGIEAQLDGNTAGNLQNQINTKANINSPTFTGDAKAQTPLTGNRSISIATTQFVGNEIAFFRQSVANNPSTSPYFLVLGSITLPASGTYHEADFSILCSGLGSYAGTPYNGNMIINGTLRRDDGRPATFNLLGNFISPPDFVTVSNIRVGYTFANNVYTIYLVLPSYTTSTNYLVLNSRNFAKSNNQFVSTEPVGITYALTRVSANQDYVNNRVGDLSTLSTSQKGTTVDAINELFTSVSNGKNSVAAAITSKGVPSQGSDTFAQLSANIRDIEQGIRYATGIANVSTTTLPFNRAAPTNVSANRLHLTVSGLNFTPARIVISGPTEDYIVEYNGTYRLANRNIIVSSNSPVDPFEVYGGNGSTYINSTGFRLPVSSTAQGGVGVRWHAYAQ